MSLDKNTLKNLRSIIMETKVVEGKLPATQDMSDPKVMQDLVEAQKTYGVKVDLVAKEIFGFNASELTPEQWGKVKKVLDIVAAQAEEAAVAPVEEITPVVEEPIVDAPIVEEPIVPVEEVPAELPMEEKKDKTIGDIEKKEGDKEEKELKSKK